MVHGVGGNSRGPRFRATPSRGIRSWIAAIRTTNRVFLRPAQWVTRKSFYLVIPPARESGTLGGMSTEVLSNGRTSDLSAARADMKLEAVVIPVSDVDRAKQFYGNLRWRLDADFAFDNGFRIVQFTPPGSGCSVQFGTNITTAP